MEERAAAGEARLPSLVVCPQTLVLHWAHEVHKFAGAAVRVVPYHGSPAVSAAWMPPLLGVILCSRVLACDGRQRVPQLRQLFFADQWHLNCIAFCNLNLDYTLVKAVPMTYERGKIGVTPQRFVAQGVKRECAPGAAGTGGAAGRREGRGPGGHVLRDTAG